MSVKLYNQGKRVIHGHALDEKDGKLKPFAFLPKTALAFDDETGAKLKKIYGNEMLSIEDVKNSFEDARPAADAAPVQGMPATNKPIDDLSGLSEAERAAVIALRNAKAPEVDPTQQPLAPLPPLPANKPLDPSNFVNVSEEEGKAALAAIQAVRAKNEAAAGLTPDPAAKPGLVDRAKAALGMGQQQDDGA